MKQQLHPNSYMLVLLVMTMIHPPAGLAALHPAAAAVPVGRARGVADAASQGGAAGKQRFGQPLPAGGRCSAH
jgi:hypothetical protein